MAIAAYVRVSTREQAEGTGLDVEAVIRSLVICKRGHRIEQGRRLNLNVHIRVFDRHEKGIEAALQNVVAEGRE